MVTKRAGTLEVWERDRFKIEIWDLGVGWCVSVCGRWWRNIMDLWDLEQQRGQVPFDVSISTVFIHKLSAYLRRYFDIRFVTNEDLRFTKSRSARRSLKHVRVCFVTHRNSFANLSTILWARPTHIYQSQPWKEALICIWRNKHRTFDLWPVTRPVTIFRSRGCI